MSTNEQTEILRKAQAEMEVGLTARVRQFEDKTGLSVVSIDVERRHTVGGSRGGEVIAVRTEVRL